MNTHDNSLIQTVYEELNEDACDQCGKTKTELGEWGRPPYTEYICKECFKGRQEEEPYTDYREGY